jgi:hypothetical protein
MASDTLLQCGRCLESLRPSLPNVCLQKECGAVNLGDDWAANERMGQQVETSIRLRHESEWLICPELLWWRRQGKGDQEKEKAQEQERREHGGYENDQHTVDWAAFVNGEGR